MASLGLFDQILTLILQYNLVDLFKKFKREKCVECKYDLFSHYLVHGG